MELIESKKKLLNKNSKILIFIFVILIIIVGGGLVLENKKLKISNNELQANYEEINKNYNELKEENSKLIKQTDDNKVTIEQLEAENKLLKEEKINSNTEVISNNVTSNTTNSNTTSNKNNNNVTNNVSGNSTSNNSNISNNTNSSDSNENVENNIVDEKAQMVQKAHKFFDDRGIEINKSGYSEMLGTNLHSGIDELEGHRVFAFTIKNYDIINNNVWFYYSPDTNAGYRYENEVWTKL